MATGFAYDTKFLAHDTGINHPEKPARASAVTQHLETLAWTSQLTAIAPRVAEADWVRTIHSPAYMERAAQSCRDGLPYLDSMDVAISKASNDVALLAAGAGLALADALMQGEIDNGFALVRPPGHHAEEDTALGFCLYNNIAILARYLQQKHGLEKIAIVDWDVHHGNGTQHSFQSDPSVMYVSTHQYPYYPGTGAADEQGEGRGKGSVLNCPMPAGANDSAYERAFMEQIIPALNNFAPDALLISAGFDAHRDDPLAEIELTTNAFRWMSTRLLEIAGQHAGGRIISLLEGGYNLDTLGPCVATHLECLGRSAELS